MKTLLLVLTLLNGHKVTINQYEIYDIYIDGRTINAPNGNHYFCKTPSSMVYFKYKKPICVKEIVIRSFSWKILK